LDTVEGSNSKTSSGKKARKRLVDDLTNQKATCLVQMFAAAGVDFEGSRFSLSCLGEYDVPKDARHIWEKSRICDAFLGMLSSQFDHSVFDYESDANHFYCLGQSLWAVLPSEVPPQGNAGKRIGSWVQTLAQDDPIIAKCLLLIAHGYTNGPNGELVSQSAFEGLARKLRMNPETEGAKLLVSLFSCDFSPSDAVTLARALRLSQNALYSLVSAARGSVEGWVRLHLYLHHQVRFDNPLVDGQGSTSRKRTKALLDTLDAMAKSKQAPEMEMQFLEACISFSHVVILNLIRAVSEI
jgi:hypothetical protein